MVVLLVLVPVPAAPVKRVTDWGAWEGEQEGMLQTGCLCADGGE